MSLTFTGQTFLVSYFIGQHLTGKHEFRLRDRDHNALADFLDKVDYETGGRGRWIITTPDHVDGFEGVCAVTGRACESLERVSLISWTEQQDDADELRALHAEKKREEAREVWAEMTAEMRAHEAGE